MPGFHWTKMVWAPAMQQQHTTDITTATTWPVPAEMAPSTPHEALRSMLTHQMDGWHPPEQASIIFGGVEGVYCPQRAPLFRQWCIATTSEYLWGHTHPLHPPKLYPLAPGYCNPSIWCIGVEHKASCGALEGYFCWCRPWSAMVVLVVVSHWRLTSDQPTVGIVKTVNGSNFFIPT